MQRLLLVGGEPAILGSRAFDILLALARRPGEVVTKGELMDAAWPGRVVEENNISVQINNLRKALGRGVILSAPGLGYRLCAEPSMREAPARGATPRSALIGREHDVRELLALLENSRLTSVVGAGGVGKTSLAREALSLTRQAACAAVHWIDLAAVSESGQVASLIAKGLGINADGGLDPLDEVALALAGRADLVALDNCEHLLDDVARCVRKLMSAAPAVSWLATSQAPLHVPGEIVYRLEPLEVPQAGLSAVEALEYGSVALLSQCVASADRRFHLDESNVDAAVQLCHRLDGLPLAIKMVAARVATFGLDEVRLRLDQRFRLLSGPMDGSYRHKTLQATFEWSYGLLSSVEQAVFRRLEPFLGGFRAEMAQQIASDVDGVVDADLFFDTLSLLIEKSLVQRCVDAPSRYMLLEGAREYARTRLNASNETAEVRRRHMAAVADWFANAQDDAARLTDAEWIERYAQERHNALAALATAVSEQAADALARLVTAVTMIDSFLCQQAQVLHCDVPLELLARAAAPLRARACLELSWAHYLDGDRDVGAKLAQAAYEIFVAHGPPELAYRALAQVTRLHEARPGMSDAANAAWASLRQIDGPHIAPRIRLFCGISCGLLHRPDYSVGQAQALGRMATEAGFDALAAVCAGNVADKMLMVHRDAEAVATARRQLPAAVGLPRARAILLNALVLALVRLGRTHEAYEPARQALQAMPSVAHLLVYSFALAAAREGRMEDAAVLHGCASHIRIARHEEPDLSEAASIAETAEFLATHLDATHRAEFMRLGAALTAAQALAIKVFPRASAATPTDVAPAVRAGRASSVGID